MVLETDSHFSDCLFVSRTAFTVYMVRTLYIWCCSLLPSCYTCLEFIVDGDRTSVFVAGRLFMHALCMFYMLHAC
jgi:hypothetical protein